MNIQLAIFVGAFQIPWPKTLLLVLLDLRCTPFGTHIFSPFETVTGYSMYLAPAVFDPHLIKGKLFHYFKDLMASIKITMFLQSNILTVHSQEMKNLSITPGNLKISSIGIDTSRRTLRPH